MSTVTGPSSVAPSPSQHSTKLPSTLTGPPVCALVPPGECQFTKEFVAVPLLERTVVSPTSAVLRFGLPDPIKPLNLSTCACILAHAEINGEAITRPYTPISTNADVGYFDLLVKNYGEFGKMSRYLNETAVPGETSVQFKHIDFNVKTQAPWNHLERIGMLVGGTGITPMIQALHAILGDTSDETKPKVTMLYGSRVSNDILGSDVLHKWAAEYPDRFELIDILSHEPEDSDWKGARGMIDKKLIETYFPAPSDDKFQIWICGPPPMYNALTGPREENDKVSGLLGDMGYKPEQVYKF